jgi:hypothetical protein
MYIPFQDIERHKFTEAQIDERETEGQMDERETELITCFLLWSLFSKKAS